jgi:hypothetical protein
MTSTPIPINRRVRPEEEYWIFSTKPDKSESSDRNA